LCACKLLLWDENGFIQMWLQIILNYQYLFQELKTFGQNDIEFTAITYKIWSIFRFNWSLYYKNVHGYNDVMAITKKYGWPHNDRYNRVWL